MSQAGSQDAVTDSEISEPNEPSARDLNQTRIISRDSAWAILIGGLLGAYASAKLAIEYMRTLADDSYISGCDVNELIGCGQFLGTSQAQAFGFPNVVIGMLTFPLVAIIGALLISRVQLPRWIEVGTIIGTTFGIGFVIWLQIQALFVIGALCPYCLVVWVAMIPIFVHTLVNLAPTRAAQNTGGVWQTLRVNRWWLIAVWYLVVIAAVLLTLREQLIGLL